MASPFLKASWNDVENLMRVTPVGIARVPSPGPIPPVQTNTIFNGTTGNDTINGTSGDDVINAFQGGNDTIKAGAGDDEIHMGNSFTTNDVIRGGDGYDTLFLGGGSYTSVLDITPAMMLGIEEIDLADGHTYTLAFENGVLTNSNALIIHADDIVAGHHVYINATSLTKRVGLVGSDGNDTFYGGSGDDTFDSTHSRTASGGNDTISLNDGFNVFEMGSDFTANDHLYGGNGQNNVILEGDYSAGITITNANMGLIDILAFYGAFDYNFTITCQQLKPFFKVDGSAITGGHAMTIDGSGETVSTIGFVGSTGSDTLKGGTLADGFDLSNGGSDSAYGGDGDDMFNFYGGGFDTTDHIVGGAGRDEVVLEHNNVTITVTGSMVQQVEEFFLFDGSFNLTVKDGAVAAGEHSAIDGENLTATQTLIADVSDETDGSYDLFGGAANDTLTGGAQADEIRGGGGVDLLTGGGGDDEFDYFDASESTSTHFDTIDKFDADHDLFSLFSVTDVDHKIGSGTLSTGAFDADLAAAVNAAHLAVNHAVIFKPNAGDFAGDTFLVIDMNGVAGYQASDDIVIALTHARHINDFSAANFGH